MSVCLLVLVVRLVLVDSLVHQCHVSHAVGENEGAICNRYLPRKLCRRGMLCGSYSRVRVVDWKNVLGLTLEHLQEVISSTKS